MSSALVGKTMETQCAEVSKRYSGNDSKTSDRFGTSFLKSLDFVRLLRYYSEEKFL